MKNMPFPVNTETPGLLPSSVKYHSMNTKGSAQHLKSPVMEYSPGWEGVTGGLTVLLYGNFCGFSLFSFCIGRK